MQRFGGTCPMCCGDLGHDVGAICVFCGFRFAADCAIKNEQQITTWLQLDGAKRNGSEDSWLRSIRSRGSPRPGAHSIDHSLAEGWVSPVASWYSG